MKEELDGLISWYVEEKKANIVKAVMLIDSRLWPQEVDIHMYKFFLTLGIEVVVVLSKIDKLSRSELDKSIAATEKDFFWQDILAVSYLKWTNINELTKYLKAVLLS